MSDLARSVASSMPIGDIFEGFKKMRVEEGPGSAALAEQQAAVLPFNPTPCPFNMPQEVYKLLLQISAVQQTTLRVITPLETLLVSALDSRRHRAVVTVGWVSGLRTAGPIAGSPGGVGAAVASRGSCRCTQTCHHIA